MSKQPKQLEPWQVADADRLTKLFEAKKSDISQAEFGARHGIGTQGMVWQYLSGTRPLNIDAAVAFAKGLDVGIADFSPTIAARILDAALVAESRSSESVPATLRWQGPKWFPPEAYRLLDLYYGTDKDGQAEIMNTAAEAKRKRLPGTAASNEA